MELTVFVTVKSLFPLSGNSIVASGAASSSACIIPSSWSPSPVPSSGTILKFVSSVLTIEPNVTDVRIVVTLTFSPAAVILNPPSTRSVPPILALPAKLFVVATAPIAWFAKTAVPFTAIVGGELMAEPAPPPKTSSVVITRDVAAIVDDGVPL